MQRFIILFVMLMNASLFAQIVGGYNSKDVSDPTIKSKARMAVLFLEEENQQEYQLIKIREAWVQIVAGTNYRLILELKAENNVEIWEVVLFVDLKRAVQLVKKTILEETKNAEFQKNFNTNKRRVGSYKERRLEEPDVQAMHTSLMNVLKADFPTWEWVKTHQVAVQIVAGANYFFLIEVKINEKTVVMEAVLFRKLDGEVSLKKMTLFETDASEHGTEPDSELLEKLKTIKLLLQQENSGVQVESVLEMKKQSVRSQKNYWFKVMSQTETETQNWEILSCEEKGELLGISWKRKVQE